jgi:Cu+-exporting ATPase
MALEPADMTAEPTRTEYTCPMHPEIVQAEPGSCPICGMALEPRTVSLEDQPNEELIDMQRRFAVSAILTVPLVVIAMLMLELRWVELALHAAPARAVVIGVDIGHI